MSERDFMTTQDVQAALGISKNKAYNLVNSEGFPKLRLGRRIVVPVKQFEAWIEKQTNGEK